jgi:hypothetical protein
VRHQRSLDMQDQKTHCTRYLQRPRDRSTERAPPQLLANQSAQLSSRRIDRLRKFRLSRLEHLLFILRTAQVHAPQTLRTTDCLGRFLLAQLLARQPRSNHPSMRKISRREKAASAISQTELSSSFFSNRPLLAKSFCASCVETRPDRMYEMDG